MKKLIIALMMGVCVLGMNAQDNESTTKIVTGAVVDDNGNPLPGALVEATGGAENVTTDADGTFKIEVPIWLKSLTATYPGLRAKKVKLHNKFSYDEKVLFEMSKQKKGYWFLNAVYGYASTKVTTNSLYEYNGYLVGWEKSGFDYGMAGFMFGYLGKWGGYIKLMLPYDTYIEVPDMSMGAIKKIYGGLYAYLGAGYSSVHYEQVHYQLGNNAGDEYQRVDWYDSHDYYNFSGVVTLEGGFIYRYKRFNVNIGYAYGTLLSGYQLNRVQASIGFCW